MTWCEAFVRSWPYDPWLVVLLVTGGWFYTRGWLRLRARGSRRFGRPQLAAFVGALLSLFAALGSPLEPFSALLLQMHMAQHLLLMMVAPPLLWLSDPMLPMWFGLPRPVRMAIVGPIAFSPLLQAVWRGLTHPVIAWLLFFIATWAWHSPPLFDVALVSASWHRAEHACFFATACLFWWPVVQPYPSRARLTRWLLVPYLLLADLQNTILAALLTFSDRVIYSHYETVPRIGALTAVDDQAIAGVMMWVPGSLVYLVPLVVIGSRLLYGGGHTRRRQSRPVTTFVSADASRSSNGVLPPLAGSLRIVARGEECGGHCGSTCGARPGKSSRGFDLLDVPILGRFFRWKYMRPTLQIPLLLVAAAIIIDGLHGPPVAPLNLAGVLPWIHWRGLLVLGLLVGGNFFCTACPFMLTRNLGKRWFRPTRSWPRWLQSKWLAAVLLAAFFCLYETFSLWDRPSWTAAIVIGYFLGAMVVDGLFRNAAFCKYVCPIGQFNFVQSLTSPLEVKVRDAAVCAACDTKDCLHGNATTTGCQLQLYLPRKVGNLDCTFCMDCVRACPHENIGVLAVVPGSALWQMTGSRNDTPWRRLDVAALLAVFVFASFVNAAAMVAPVAELLDRIVRSFAMSSRALVVGTVLVGALVALPAVVVGMTAAVARWWSGESARLREVAARFVPALVPLGAAMWLAHYSFHLFSNPDAPLPAIERFVADCGLSWHGPAATSGNCCAPVADWLLRLEILALDAGLLASLYAAYRIAKTCYERRAVSLKAFLPWAVLALVLFGFGVWLVFQPMEMRGTMQMAG